MQIQTLEELRQADEMSLRFTRGGFSCGDTLTAASAASWHQEEIADLDLVPGVGDATVAAFERTRLVHSLGVLSYELYSVAETQARFVLELALRERFISWFDGSLTLVRNEEYQAVEMARYADVMDAVGPKGSHRKGWRLHCLSGQDIAFRGGLRDLIGWAHADGLLRGQRNRFRLEAAIDLRNESAHPEGTSTVSPVDSAWAIKHLADLINQLYEPDMRQQRRDRFVAFLGWDAAGRRWVQQRPDLEDFANDSTLSCASFLMCGEEPWPWGCDSWYERTALPSSYLWGPGTVAEAIAWHDSQMPEGDNVDTIDRWFAIRQGPSSLETIDAATLHSVREADRDGVWSLVQADSPGDAVNHVRHLDGVNHLVPTGDGCEECPATVRAVGSWRDVSAAASSVQIASRGRPIMHLRIPW